MDRQERDAAINDAFQRRLREKRTVSQWSAVEVIGWVCGKLRHRYGDETGIVHLLVGEPAYGLFARVRPVCGTRAMLSGQVERQVPAGTKACRKCAAWKEREGARS